MERLTFEGNFCDIAQCRDLACQQSGNWPQMLHDGFHECMRVLKPDGVLIFKWSEVQIEAKKVWEAIGEKPLFGHRSGKQAKTFWGCFMKLGLPEAPEEGNT